MLPAASVSKLRESLTDWKWTFPFPFHGVVFLSVPSATIFNQVIAPFVPKRCWVNTRNDYLVPHRIFVTKTSCNNKPNKAVRVKIEERYSLDGIIGIRLCAYLAETSRDCPYFEQTCYNLRALCKCKHNSCRWIHKNPLLGKPFYDLKRSILLSIPLKHTTCCFCCFCLF